tara:strand:+ start:329 stop:595 length:267 start_codon:yes stop_codon:yes gene_type:complete
MGDVIDINTNGIECFSYDTQKHYMEVMINEHELSVSSDGVSAKLSLNGLSLELDRMELASFLYACATMLDSEERTRNGEYPALDYINT